MREDPSPTQHSPSVKALPLGHKSGASVLPVSSLLDRAAMRLPLSRPAGVRSANTLLASAAAHVLTRMCTHARLRFEGLQSIASFARLCWHTCTCKPWKASPGPHPQPFSWMAGLVESSLRVYCARGKKTLKGLGRNGEAKGARSGGWPSCELPGAAAACNGKHVRLQKASEPSWLRKRARTRAAEEGGGGGGGGAGGTGSLLREEEVQQRARETVRETKSLN